MYGVNVHARTRTHMYPACKRGKFRCPRYFEYIKAIRKLLEKNSSASWRGKSLWILMVVKPVENTDSPLKLERIWLWSFYGFKQCLIQDGSAVWRTREASALVQTWLSDVWNAQPYNKTRDGTIQDQLCLCVCNMNVLLSPKTDWLHSKICNSQKKCIFSHIFFLQLPKFLYINSPTSIARKYLCTPSCTWWCT